jgi:hypothetical protein
MSFRRANARMAAQYAAEQQKLEKDRLDFLEKQAKAQSKAEKKARKKSLFSSIGGTLGSLLAPALIATTGPIGAALVAGGGSALGSLLGGSVSDGQLLRDKRVDIDASPTSQGRFLTGKREMFDIQKDRERDALKEYQKIAEDTLLQQQITGALGAGLTAGMDAGLDDFKFSDLFKKSGETATEGLKVGSNLGSGIGLGTPTFNQGKFSFGTGKVGLG